MMKRLASGVAAVALIMGGMAFFGAFGAEASSTPTITITPNSGLANAQSVQVTGSGFTPNQGLGSMAAVECIATATTSAGCDTTDYVLVTSDASGNVSFHFSVRTGTIGNGTCGTSATDATCLISVGTVSTQTTLAAATITFAVGGSTTTTTTPTTTTTVPSSNKPSVQVTSLSALSNGTSVSITGANFTPGDSVYAVECLATATSAAGCDAATATPITVNSDGTLPGTKFKVVTGTIGTGKCGTSSSNLSSCVIEVANPSGADAGAAPITFKALNVIAPKATKTTGTAVPGKTVVITVLGNHFTAVSRVSGPAGASVSVKSVTASRLTLKIKEAANAKKGSYTLTIHFKSGKRATVKYTVK
jgi:hypothetical protein